MDKDPWNMIIAGVGGQGNVLASQIVGQILVNLNYLVTIGETYGLSQRGGSVMSHLRVSRRAQFSPLVPRGKCDFVLGLEPTEALRVLKDYGNPDVRVLANTRPIYPMDVISGEASYPRLDTVLERIEGLSRRLWVIDATVIALEMGDPIYSNMVMLGALSQLEILPVTRQGFHDVVNELLPSKTLAGNLEAFDRGRKAVQENIA
ncbi:MAG: indolepyruvate oxidoreductase subunit beta [Deltaproteobacteria bacterium]|nr:indolepyruvate oxidoreductase subunit beta [Deltaproteobacteria bacterium]